MSSLRLLIDLVYLFILGAILCLLMDSSPEDEE